MALDLSMLDGDGGAAFGGSSTGVPRALLTLFEEDPANPRFEEDPEEFRLFVADVRMRGILQPIVVRRLDGGRLQIRFGARRHRAAIAAGLIEAPYIVTDDPRQLDDYAQVAENQQRVALQPLELALFAAKKIAAGEKKLAVAAGLGMRPSALSHLLCLSGAVPAFILELYHARRCRTPLYLYRLRQLWRRDPLRVEAECAAAPEVGAALIDAIELNLQRGGGAALPNGAETGAPSALVADAGGEAGAVGRTVPVGALPEGERGTPSPSRRRARSRPGVRSFKPLLFGIWQGREVVLRLRMRPSAEGMIWVQRCDDRKEMEVPIIDFVLKRVVDAAS
jgi:ParB family chromosome partitioning protein